MNFHNEEYIQYSKEKRRKETRSIAWYLTTHIILYIALIFFLIFFAWYTWFFVTHRYYIVEGTSMQPTLNSGTLLESDSKDAVYVNIYDSPDFGNIVVLDTSNIPSYKSNYIIKRILGTAGDYVSIVRSEGSYHIYRIPSESIILNDDGVATGSLLDDANAILRENSSSFNYSIDYDAWSYLTGISYNGYTYEGNFYDKIIQTADSNDLFVSTNGIVYVRVPEDSLFCVGDNRYSSSDSRSNGFISASIVVGCVDIIVYDYSFGNRILQVITFYYKQVEDFFAR